jgi:hypothetical protein
VVGCPETTAGAGLILYAATGVDCPIAVEPIDPSADTAARHDSVHLAILG